MLHIKRKISVLLLFLIAVLWGNIWTTEILSCPEWWFIGVNALLFGTGTYLRKFIPQVWRQTAPGWLLLLLLPIDHIVIHSVLLPLFSGIWYGCNLHLSLSWKTSRTFCAGLLIGGILAGVFTDLTITPLILTVAVIFHGSLQKNIIAFADALLLAGFCFFARPAAVETTPPELDPGTVISAFALVPDKTAENKMPRIVFVGGKESALARTVMASPAKPLGVLGPAANIFFMPELPGTVPAKSDLIILLSMPSSGKSGLLSLVNSLAPDGVLLMPAEYCRMLPRYSWYIMPGSDGKYAAASPDKECIIIPDAVDRQLVDHFSAVPEHAPLGGALAGMLLDFENRKLILPQPQGKQFFRFLNYTLAAGFILLITWIARIKQGGKDNFRIILNCAGLSMLTALLMPSALAALPAVPAVTSLMTVCALIWFFRRPVTSYSAKTDHYRRLPGISMPLNIRIAISGALSAISLLTAFSGNGFAALAALISGGYFFAELDGELCGERNFDTEPVRFLGIAAGAFAAYFLISRGIEFKEFLLTVLLLRIWSFLRS